MRSLNELQHTSFSCVVDSGFVLQVGDDDAADEILEDFLVAGGIARVRCTLNINQLPRICFKIPLVCGCGTKQ